MYGACVCVHARACVSDPRFIQFALGSCYAVNIMKVYIERNNIQVELIRFRKNIDFIHVYFCEARKSPTDAMVTQHDRWICVIDRSV